MPKLRRLVASLYAVPTLRRLVASLYAVPSLRRLVASLYAVPWHRRIVAKLCAVLRFRRLVANLFTMPWHRRLVAQPLRHAIAQAVSCRILCAVAWVQTEASSCGICGGKSGNVTGFSPSTSNFSCQYHPTIVPCSSIRHQSHIISVISTVIK